MRLFLPLYCCFTLRTFSSPVYKGRMDFSTKTLGSQLLSRGLRPCPWLSATMQMFAEPKLVCTTALVSQFLLLSQKRKPYFTCCIPGRSVGSRDFPVAPNYVTTFHVVIQVTFQQFLLQGGLRLP